MQFGPCLSIDFPSVSSKSNTKTPENIILIQSDSQAIGTGNDHPHNVSDAPPLGGISKDLVLQLKKKILNLCSHQPSL